MLSYYKYKQKYKYLKNIKIKYKEFINILFKKSAKYQINGVILLSNKSKKKHVNINNNIIFFQ